MKLINLINKTLLFLFFSKITNAMYIVHDENNPVKQEEISNNNPFHDVCIVKNTSDRSYGTGCFISEDTVLTALHVVSNPTEEKKYILPSLRMASPEVLKIYNHGQEIAVKESYCYKEGLDDIALLKLDSPVDITHQPWRQVQSTQIDGTLPLYITVGGYGKGRVISDSKVFIEDIEFAHQVGWGPFFRYRQNFQADSLACSESTKDIFDRLKSHMPSNVVESKPTYKRLHEINMKSKYIRLAMGDSGSPLIDFTTNNIIGVAQWGVNDFSNQDDIMLQEINSTFERIKSIGHIVTPVLSLSAQTAFHVQFMGSTWYEGLVLGTLTHMAIMGSLNNHLEWNIYKYIYKQKALKRDNEILARLKNGGYLGSHFCGFDDEAVGWINDILSDTRK
jgi:hypothetical protein